MPESGEGPPPMWPHQEEAVEFMRNRAGGLLAMEMGTGKTRVAIEHIRRHGCRRTLILAPLSVVDHVWPDEVEKHAPGLIQTLALGSGYQGGRKKSEAAMRMLNGLSRQTPAIVAANYELVLNAGFQEWALSQRWDLLLLDECHRIKAPEGKISRTAAMLGKQSRMRLGLSGTPMPHSPLDIFGQYRTLAPEIYGTSWHAFRHRYAVYAPQMLGKDRNRPIIAGYQNLPELRTKYLEAAHEVRSADVLDLPGFGHHTLRVRLTPEARGIYRQMEEELAAELASGELVTARHALTKIVRLQQITSGYLPKPDGQAEQVCAAKESALTEYLDGLDAQEPVVVFGRFTEDLAAIHRAAEKTGRPHWELSGQRKELEQWQRRGGVLAAQIQTAGSGIDLTQANRCIYYSMTFNLGDLLQSQARLHRPGQTRRVMYVYLIAANTIDEAIHRSVQRKEDLIQKILWTRKVQPTP